MTSSHHQIIIAVDGYSSCGKSTLSRDLANALGYKYIDTGAMYRAATLHLMEKGIIKDGKFSVEEVIKEIPNIPIPEPPIGGLGAVSSEKIRSMEVASMVSKISAIHELRVKMVALQREMGKQGGVVMDGRDIGTVVFPRAELKIFMTADVDIRAQRRKSELESKGIKVSQEEVKKNLQQRDEEDTNRKESPLRKATDAIILDNSYLNREQQLALALKWARGESTT